MIHVERLTKYFGNVLAVSNVSFQVEKNEIVGLLGNNGAGKTTIMRILTTYLPASSGVVKVDGFDVMKDSLEVRKRIGYLPESIPLYGEMRVDEYLDYRAKIKGVERHRRPGRVAYCIDRCRLEGVRRALLGTLSKGFRQRVGLADTLIADPPLLILDEPTDGLDPGQKQETLGMLRELGQNHTIMLSSHLLTEVETIAQRVIILRRGHLGLAKKLSELEADAVIVLEVRGPADQVLHALRGVDGVTEATSRNLGDGLNAYEVRTRHSADLREQIFRVVANNNWAVRRLDLRRRGLQDRWNEINNQDDAALQTSVAPVPAVGAGSVNPKGQSIVGDSLRESLGP
ncbi:MAG TPA: ABC transporter [Planctomycetales bacterium]|jgi:ABC-2 type transport system ATP-binding protein|nr:ABC transporter [Planctomycetales bacterium]